MFYKKYQLTLVLITVFAASLLAVTATQAQMLEIKNPFDSLQIPIPGMQRFQDAEISNSKELKSSWIAEYMIGIYRYGIGVAGIAAMLAISIGGSLWVVSAGNSSKLASAISWIKGGITGLVLLMGAYLLLSTINTDLVDIKPIIINAVVDDDFKPSTNDQTTTAPSGLNQAPDSNIPMIYQCSSEGKSQVYGPDCPNQPTICTSGCGVVSLQMILASHGTLPGLKALTDAAVSNGARVCGQGSSITGLIKTAGAYGYQGQTVSVNSISSYLDQGIPVIVLVHNKSGNCIFTEGGHYIVATGWRDKGAKEININDPSNSSNIETRTHTTLGNWGGCSASNAIIIQK